MLSYNFHATNSDFGMNCYAQSIRITSMSDFSAFLWDNFSIVSSIYVRSNFFSMSIKFKSIVPANFLSSCFKSLCSELFSWIFSFYNTNRSAYFKSWSPMSRNFLWSALVNSWGSNYDFISSTFLWTSFYAQLLKLLSISTV